MSLTPMLDVVFILLIFFVVTSVFTKEDTFGLEVPLSGASGPPATAITIHIAEQGLIRVNDQLTDIGAVRSRIEYYKAVDPETLIVIEADPKAKAGWVALVRDAAYSAGYESGVNLQLSQDT